MGFRFYFVLFIISILSLTASAQKVQSTPSAAQLIDAFSTASKAYNVPADLLKAVAYEQTRYSNIIESDADRGPGVQPPLYGVMGLRNDNWFGHSLIEGAKLINQSADVVAVNPYYNIQAAAALLSSIADSLNINRTNLNNWRPVLEEFSGIPQKDIKPFFTFDVFKVLSDGSDLDGINIPKYTEINMNQFSRFVNPKSIKKSKETIQKVEDTDYGPAVWEPSPNFYNDNNFNQLFAVVHDTEGPFASALSWLRNPQAQASAHYIIRSSDGYIVQMVRERYAAWHVVCWNRYMLGVEHEGYVNQPSFFTDTMYKASAGLFRHFIEKYGIPLDSNHIIGHDQHLFPWWVDYMHKNYPYIDPTCNTHTDPGKYWNWHYYFGLIRSDATIPFLASYSPNITDSAWTNSQIKLTFSIAMDTAATRKAFSISPDVGGTFSWQDYKHTLVFTPSALLSNSTEYKVTIDTSAKSILNVSPDSMFSFNFVTQSLKQLSVKDSYPESNQTGLSTTLKVIIKFNLPLIQSSLSGNVLLQDSSGKNLSIKDAFYKVVNDTGIVMFQPMDQLVSNSSYKVIIKAGIQCINSSKLGNDFVINFTTAKNNFIKGTAVDNFESIGGWFGPNANSGSVGIDTTKSNFLVAYGISENGQHAGILRYVFNSSKGGICSIEDSAKLNIGSGTNNKFGIWIFGDQSNNYMNLEFSNAANQNASVRLDTLNWTGWKFIEIPYGSIGISGNMLFTGISIMQSRAGDDSNIVYIDGAQYRDTTATSVSNKDLSEVPSKFLLEQNYPNPFNPSTQINYQLHVGSYVTLKIYDVLGREVETLVNERQNAGKYTINFNADKLTSGIYFYTLKAGSFVSTKKMLLLK